MDDTYKKLGFERAKILENPYGIKIYIGTKGEDDWCVEVPKELCNIKCSSFKYDKNFMFYLVTEEYALEIASKYTELAKSSVDLFKR